MEAQRITRAWTLLIVRLTHDNKSPRQLEHHVTHHSLPSPLPYSYPGPSPLIYPHSAPSHTHIIDNTISPFLIKFNVPSRILLFFRPQGPFTIMSHTLPQMMPVVRARNSYPVKEWAGPRQVPPPSRPHSPSPHAPQQPGYDCK